MRRLGLAVLVMLFCNYAVAATIADELTKLNNLYKEGAITKEEFSKAKSILLKSNSNKSTIKIKKAKTKVKESEKTKKTVDERKKVKLKTFDEDLSETFIALEEVNELGTFKKIERVPAGMFEETHITFKARAKKSMMDMYDVFVKRKGLMEKYPENMMKAMGYFEFFYMDQLDKKKITIDKFKKKYPDVGWRLAKEMKGLYSLNQAKKSMREAMGLTLDDNPEKALEYYMVMYNFLKQGEKKTNQLTGSEKKLKKESANFKKHYSSFKKTVKLKSEKRIDQKTFDKDLKKNIKNVKNTLKKLSTIDSKSDKLYLTTSDMFEKSLEMLEKCGANCERKDLATVIDSVDFTNAVLADAEKNIIKKRFTQDMSKIDIETLSDQQKQILMSVSSKMKNQKRLKREQLQNSVLNLENNDYPVNEFLDKIEEQGFEIKTISMSFESVGEMKKWAMKDWAKAWRGGLPSEVVDSGGNLIKFTEKNIEDVKAQLAINTFSSMIDTSALEINESMNENIKEITNAIETSGGFDLDAWLAQDFTITLNNYSQLVGNSYGIEMNDFNDLTRFANELYGTDISPEEYAYQWETAKVGSSTSNWGDITRGVDLIEQVGSFEAASIAANLGTDLQTVADSIALAASVGISTDLDAAAQGLGYGNFADAVAAYNAQYGTSYTVDEAKKALGQ